MYRLIDQTVSPVAVQHLCQIAQVARSGYYRHQHLASRENSPDPVCGELHRICHEHGAYGYRRVTQELRRRGHHVNHKRVLALMRKEKLLCRPRRRFVRTTNSRHGLPVYPNLARTMTVTHCDQLWVADITYIRLIHGCVYLAVILDAFSRRAVGWTLSSHIDAVLSLRALTMALESRRPPGGLVHHSDQGVQYACQDYVATLVSQNVTISMSRKGNPYDNAKAESFIKTLKAEEVYLNEYETLHDAATNIDHFISVVYNQKRLHSSLGYRTPCEYEAIFNNQTTRDLSTLSTPETVSA